MSRNPLAKLVVLGLVLPLASAPALARRDDRNQPMDIQSAAMDGSFLNDGTTILTNDVVITQGTLEIRAARAEIIIKGGEPVRGIFTGKQAAMKQVNDDGTPMNATADRIDYDMKSNIVTLTGNYTVKSPKGTNSGQRMVYNTESGNMQSGGDGSRVHTVIQPKARPAQTPPAGTP